MPTGLDKELFNRHYERVVASNKVENMLKQLRTAREQQGLTLADVSERTGMDASALPQLESGERPTPTIATLLRYADAVEMALVEVS